MSDLKNLAEMINECVASVERLSDDIECLKVDLMSILADVDDEPITEDDKAPEVDLDFDLNTVDLPRNFEAAYKKYVNGEVSARTAALLCNMSRKFFIKCANAKALKSTARKSFEQKKMVPKKPKYKNPYIRTHSMSIEQAVYCLRERLIKSERTNKLPDNFIDVYLEHKKGVSLKNLAKKYKVSYWSLITWVRFVKKMEINGDDNSGRR